MEYLKSEKLTPILCNFIERRSRFSDEQSSRAIASLQYSNTPSLLELLEAVTNISDIA